MQVRDDQIHKCVLGATDLDIRPYRLKQAWVDLIASLFIRKQLQFEITTIVNWIKWTILQKLWNHDFCKCVTRYITIAPHLQSFNLLN